MPGKGDVMEGAIQQAPQPARQVGSDWHDMVKVQRQDADNTMTAPPIRRHVGIVPDPIRETCNKAQLE
ncbi:hypothetical protein [Cupriavidus sp. D384]|uniref:hypothetical protein n=1 Tax=Cupriavidus sp. D384 TaxID=1538095 RepID=UPI000832AF02|nr:hypothetical protein [Cupriavidus sp. D384]